MVLLNCTYVHMSLYKYILLSNLQPLPNIILIKIYLKYYPKDSSVVNLIECYSPWVLSLSFRFLTVYIALITEYVIYAMLY